MTFVRGTQICLSNRGLLAVAGFRNDSPRHVTNSNCVPVHRCAINIGIAFWLGYRGGCKRRWFKGCGERNGAFFDGGFIEFILCELYECKFSSRGPTR